MKPIFFTISGILFGLVFAADAWAHEMDYFDWQHGFVAGVLVVVAIEFLLAEWE